MGEITLNEEPFSCRAAALFGPEGTADVMIGGWAWPSQGTAALEPSPPEQVDSSDRSQAAFGEWTPFPKDSRNTTLGPGFW